MERKLTQRQLSFYLQCGQRNQFEVQDMNTLHWLPIGKEAPCKAPLSELHALERTFFSDILAGSKELCPICKAEFIKQHKSWINEFCYGEANGC